MNSVITCILLGIGAAAGFLLAFYLILCGICWIQDVFDKTTWRWKK